MAALYSSNNLHQMCEFLLLDEEGMGSNILKLCNDQERKAKLLRVSHVQTAIPGHHLLYL